MINKFQNSGVIKRVAHAINEYGEKETVPHIYGSFFPTMAINKALNTIKGKDKKFHRISNSQNAAANSVLGSFTTFIPGVGPVVSALTSIPDQIYDWAEFIDKPKNSNAVHVALDYPELLGKIIPGPVDDAVLKVGNLVSNADDLASTGGKNIFSFLDSPENRLATQYDRSKPQISSTYVYKPTTNDILIDEKIIKSYKQGGILKRVESGKSGIHIKPENRGKLTRLKKRTGKTEAELWKEGDPAVRKMITFARNARK